MLRANNLKIHTIKNAKFSGFYFYMNLNIWEDFQICISVPLRRFLVKLEKPTCFAALIKMWRYALL